VDHCDISLVFDNEEFNSALDFEGSVQDCGPANATLDLVSEVKIDVCRGKSAAYINRTNLATQIAFPSNNDTLVTWSSPGLTHYLVNYLCKSQDDGLLSSQRMLQTLKYKLSHENLNSTAYENGISTTVAALLSSTSTQDVSSPMAAWLIGPGNDSRAIFSHCFQAIYLSSVSAYLRNEAVSVTLSPAADDGSRIANVSILTYAHRGSVLEDLSLYEQTEWYEAVNKLTTSKLSTKPEHVRLRKARALKDATGSVDRHATTGPFFSLLWLDLALWIVMTHCALHCVHVLFLLNFNSSNNYFHESNSPLTTNNPQRHGACACLLFTSLVIFLSLSTLPP
jgi:hypothetical protein